MAELTSWRIKQRRGRAYHKPKWRTRTVTSSNPRRVGQSELGVFLASCRGAFMGIGLMTAMINVLYLTGSFFMLEVYDRVLPSRSIPTLVGLAELRLWRCPF